MHAENVKSSTELFFAAVSAHASVCVCVCVWFIAKYITLQHMLALPSTKEVN